MEDSRVRLYSFNVNGVRAAAKKGLLDWLDDVQPDVLCLQETKADPAALPDDLVHPRGYHGHWAAAEKKGYSGVATLCRTPPSSWRAGLGIQRFDSEGRVVVTDMGDFDLYNVYFPNGRSGAERLGYKMAFYAAFLDHINERVRAGRPVIFCGDVNTAHREIDLARPKENRKTSGFMPEECAALDQWLEHGWVDTFRHFYPEVTEAYSWWDQRMNARARNVGWRIDYFFVPNTLLDRVQDAGICPEVMGSDHCPIWLELRD
jgi:exodeoxyribonuclease-3